MTEVKTDPFLGWTNDKDILNQQREYWGAMNGIKALQEENRKLREALKDVQRVLLVEMPGMNIDSMGGKYFNKIIRLIKDGLNEERK